MSKQYTLGNFTISLSGWGKSKDKTKGSDLYNDNDSDNSHPAGLESEVLDVAEFGVEMESEVKPDIWMFGQDGFGVYAVDADTDTSTIIMANTDGHGGTRPLMKEGIDFAYYSLVFSITEISKHINEIKKLVIENNKRDLDLFMNDIFQKLDNFLLYDFPLTNKYIAGGSTLTINIKFVHKNRLISITTNTGDSVLMHIATNKKNIKITEETVALNCDRLGSYNIYISKCNETHTIPKDIYLGRFNINPKKKVGWVDPMSKFNKPILPFKLIKEIDENSVDIYRAEHNVEVMEKFYNNAPPYFKETHLKVGGTQSLRDRGYNIEQMEKGNYPSTNFGNTIEGRCQCLPGGSIGDRIDKNGNRNIMITHTSLRIFKTIRSCGNNGKEIEIIGTDGFFDTITDELILEGLEINNNSNSNIIESKNNLNEIMFSETRKNLWGTNWDDITYCIIEITQNKSNRSNRSKNKFKMKRDNRKRRRKMNKYH
jgi:serine/threonine protein phosphatase PrpC